MDTLADIKVQLCFCFKLSIRNAKFSTFFCLVNVLFDLRGMKERYGRNENRGGGGGKNAEPPGRTRGGKGWGGVE